VAGDSSKAVSRLSVAPSAGKRGGFVRRLPWILAVVFLVWFFAWSNGKVSAPANEPPATEARLTAMGFSDHLTLLGGRRFAEEGFFKHYFLSNMTVGYPEFARGWYHYQVPLNTQNSSIYYTHYGSLDTVANGVLQKVGITDLRTLYQISALVVAAGLVFWFIAIRRLFDDWVALISMVVMATSLVFLRLSNTIAGYSYDFFLAFGALALFVYGWEALRRTETPALRIAATNQENGAASASRARWSAATASLRSRRSAYTMFVGAWLLVFLQASNTPEFVIWLQISFVTIVWATEGSWRGLRGRWRLIAAFVAAPVAAMLVHFIQVAVALGGVGNLIADLRAALERRTVGFELAEETPFRGFNIDDSLSFINGSAGDMLKIGLLGILLLMVVALALTRVVVLTDEDCRERRRQWWLAVGFTIAGFAFMVIFVQTTVTATGIIFRLALPALGLAIGLITVLAVQPLRRGWRPMTVRFGATVLAVVLIAPIAADRVSGDATDLGMQFQTDFYYGRHQTEITAVSELVAENTSFGDVVLTPLPLQGATGHPRYPVPVYEYTANRRFELTPTFAAFQTALQEMRDKRDSLDRENPAHGIDFYLLLPDEQTSTFSDYVEANGDRVGVFDFDGWWESARGAVPQDILLVAPRRVSLWRLADTASDRTVAEHVAAPAPDSASADPAESEHPDRQAAADESDRPTEAAADSPQSEPDAESKEAEKDLDPVLVRIGAPPRTGDVGAGTLPATIRVSGQQVESAPARSLVDGDLQTFWDPREAVPPGETEWIELKFEPAIQVASVSVHPRADDPTPLWSGPSVRMDRMNASQRWQPIVAFSLPPDDVGAGGWVTFTLPDVLTAESLRLVFLDGAPRPIAELRIGGPGQIPETALELLSDPVQEQIAWREDADWYVFDALAGQQYTIETADNTFDTVLTLYDVDATTGVLADDDGGASPLASRIDWFAPADGRYYVVVRSFDGEDGTYSVKRTP
jgi:hypothetical protein